MSPKGKNNNNSRFGAYDSYKDFLAVLMFHKPNAAVTPTAIKHYFGISDGEASRVYSLGRLGGTIVRADAGGYRVADYRTSQKIKASIQASVKPMAEGIRQDATNH